MKIKNLFHPLSDVQSQKIGIGTQIMQFAVVLEGAIIGNDSIISSHCFIDKDVLIGNRVHIKMGAYLGNGIRIGDDVDIGSNVTFLSSIDPQVIKTDQEMPPTIVESKVIIGAGVVIFPGIRIGSEAIINPGSVISKSVPSGSVVDGSPAKIIGYVNNSTYSDTLSNEFQNTFLGGSSRVNKIGDSGVTLHHLKLIEDLRGDLTVGEFLVDIPFLPKRYFFICNVPNAESRGEHAHLKCKQFLICVKGKCSVVIDDGAIRKEVLLNSPNIGLYIPEFIWAIQYKYSSDAMLLVFASEYYEETDYIRDYAHFLELRKNKLS